eukprot:scaffold206354_cov31-Prasinocladus_malaysianus.AAC.1
MTERCGLFGRRPPRVAQAAHVGGFNVKVCEGCNLGEGGDTFVIELMVHCHAETNQLLQMSNTLKTPAA